MKVIKFGKMRWCVFEVVFALCAGMTLGFLTCESEGSWVGELLVGGMGYV